MGGYGSGDWLRYDTKTTTENQHRIDIRWLKKEGSLEPGIFGSLSWSSRGKQTGRVDYRITEHYMKLFYDYRKNGGDWFTVEETIYFDVTPLQLWGLTEMVPVPSL